MNDREAAWTRVNLIIAISDADWAWAIEDRKLQEAQKELDELAAKWGTVDSAERRTREEMYRMGAHGIEYQYFIRQQFNPNQQRAYADHRFAERKKEDHLARVEVLKKIIGDATAERTKQQYRLAHLRKEQSEQNTATR